MAKPDNYVRACQDAIAIITMLEDDELMNNANRYMVEMVCDGGLMRLCECMAAFAAILGATLTKLCEFSPSSAATPAMFLAEFALKLYED